MSLDLTVNAAFCHVVVNMRRGKDARQLKSGSCDFLSSSHDLGLFHEHNRNKEKRKT